MLKNNSFYKSSDLLNESYRGRMNSYFNPYECNFESNKKDMVNSDVKVMKSQEHFIRKSTKTK